MLILQHVWARWDKHDRGAGSGQKHLALEAAYPLKPPVGPVAAGTVWRHGVRCLKQEDYRIEQVAGAIRLDDWRREQPMHAPALAWVWRGATPEISLERPGAGLVTAWPTALPSPLKVLKPDEVVRIDWNGRFATSRSEYYYESHTYWLGLVEAPAPDLFTARAPDKHIDLRTRIY